jgi:CheY-like chemotaxis protein
MNCSCGSIFLISFTVLALRSLRRKVHDEALTLLGTNIDVDLILTDIQMPGQIDGLGLVSSVQRPPYQTCFIIRKH